MSILELVYQKFSDIDKTILEKDTIDFILSMKNLNYIGYKGEIIRVFIKGIKTKGKILSELKSFGITDSFVFPEVSTICNEIKKSVK